MQSVRSPCCANSSMYLCASPMSRHFVSEDGREGGGRGGGRGDERGYRALSVRCSRHTLFQSWKDNVVSTLKCFR